MPAVAWSNALRSFSSLTQPMGDFVHLRKASFTVLPLTWAVYGSVPHWNMIVYSILGSLQDTLRLSEAEETLGQHDRHREAVAELPLQFLDFGVQPSDFLRRHRVISAGPGQERTAAAISFARPGLNVTAVPTLTAWAPRTTR